MHLSPIEYIGSKPRKPKKKATLIRVVVISFLVFIGIIGFYKFGATKLIAAQGNEVNKLSPQEFIKKNIGLDTVEEKFLRAALERTEKSVTYDPRYYEISYPLGDIPENRGLCADVVVRTYREIGIDLQQLVYEDMMANYPSYPKSWELLKPDSNIDHRRVPNLKNFFLRNGENLTLSNDAQDYHYGDIVTWKLDHGASHIGIVVPSPIENDSTPWVVHNVGLGPQWEDRLFEYEITGHFRYEVN